MISLIDFFENINVLIIQTPYLHGNMCHYYSFISELLLPKLKDKKSIKLFSFKCEGIEKEKEFKDVNEIEDYLKRVGPIFQ